MADLLQGYFGDRACVYNFDNHQKSKHNLPITERMRNWDHPESINWQDFLTNLRKLKRGETVVIRQREQQTLRGRARAVTFSPAEIVIVEGYLLFHNPVVRELLDFKIFVDASDEVRMERRTKFKRPRYTEKILLPAHHEFIEPTKRYADLILNTGQLSLQECRDQILDRLKQYSLW